jgi:SpoVK/Ycf46/Vps4 family AAA+-type ATPase
MKNNNTVYDIQEYITFAEKRFSETVDSDMFIIKQKSPILYNNSLQIYAITEIKKEESNLEKGSTTKIDNITITLYSYKCNISQIQDFVDNIKQTYLDQIENNRIGKKFIYSLKKIPTKDDDGNTELWNETIFESTRTFTNMFFEEKENVLNKILFFLNNKEWYYENGIPYTLGIGLYGPPGTGKTSFFKSIANLTGRHIVILSLKTIKTKQQLEETFFETRYNNENKINSIGFDKKIIIIEDIDCLGELVWKREKTIKKNNKKPSPTQTNNTQNAVNTVLNQLIENNTNNEKTDFIDLCKKSDDPITLDDILNLWDGIKETPGRILGISSNHYDKLDPALIRPGRIDITLHLNNCTRNIIKQMYKQYYKSDIDENILNNIKDGYFSPAEVINFYVLNRENPEKFLDCFIKNKVRKS